MQAVYVIKRFGVFLLIVWVAATLNFFLPKLSGQDPVRTKLLQEAAIGGNVQVGMEQMVKEYDARFGLDRPVLAQYGSYLYEIAHFDLNYSISSYPRTVKGLIAEALPWTVGLLATTTLLSFAIGTLLGALLAWPRAPAWMRYLMPPLWALHAIPFFLFGLILVYIFAFKLQILPMFGGYSPGAAPGLNWDFISDVATHSILPALSIILVSIGGWALTMRGMMVATMGEDYVVFAEAKGLRAGTVFMRYCVRNAILPQTTALVLALGQILSGAVLVEVVFGFPGIGALLFHAIEENDQFLIQGIVFTVIAALGLATFALDVAYPLLDPRISYRRT
jgi:peptide/nickel transport system permease protein